MDEVLAVILVAAVGYSAYQLKIIADSMTQALKQLDEIKYWQKKSSDVLVEIEDTTKYYVGLLDADGDK